MRKVDFSAGFTVIELLITISVIGILAVILVPNLLRAFKSAHDSEAKAYIYDAVKFQEMSRVDTGNYTDKATLLTLGLREEPNQLILNVTTATGTFCMSSTHQGGSGKTFYATPELGVTESAC
ncbi:type IV pilin protein [Deinococcus cellulosilyticus]|uniref:Prepilin-type N-terminal cleavage/methylation domain-containing protein n=1 Tax=Deinococcus cellulosilyticus (strain DSM 18568 / NBRC 106333 / KACC 11606 / 5516J-15) TaxID=1223518 RepID=A0A511MWE2_DEIC1|nr:prepilin-type N-terminal cleavage/methylation domain-containing protein [Deinococcus cellulosilyticus]GEM44870.1 hypothetical protein DC3_05050 [Deinococcus cellulosilyticus NBRC 106333 = KACC 11606]